MSTWGELYKEPEKSSGLGSFVKIEDGQTIKMRILDEEPYLTRVHRVSQWTEKDGKKVEMFRKIQATEKADESYILNATSRYPMQIEYNIRGFQYGEGGGIKVLSGGKKMFTQIHGVMETNGPLRDYDITIRRTGKGKQDTEYLVQAVVRSEQVDVGALVAQMNADPSMQWASLFAPITAEQQQKILKDAGMDIAYDPAKLIASGMSVEEAKNVAFPNGKNKDKKVGDVAISDMGYVEWAASNYTSNDTVAAACRVVVQNINNLGAPTPTARIEAPKSDAAPAADTAVSRARPAQAAAAKKTASAADSPEYQKLREQANSLLDAVDTSRLMDIIKGASGGKTKMKDMSLDELRSVVTALEQAGNA